MKKALFILSLGFASTAFAIEPFQASYQFAYNGKNVGSATRTLKQNGQDWTYNFSASAGMLASASETSKFTLNNGLVNSKSFTRNSKVLVHQDTMSIQFNPAQKVISTQKKEVPRTFAWKANALDELNAEIQIREDLTVSKLKSTYLLTDAKGIDTRKFIQEGTAKIQTPYGTFDTVKVKMQHSKPERNTIFWLAPKLNYLPVKIAHNDGGTSYGLTLTKYNPS